MYFLGAADKAPGRHTLTEAVQRRLCGSQDLGMVGKAEIVVGAKINDLATGNLDPGLLRRLQNAFFLVQSRPADLLQFQPNRLLEGV